MAAFFLFSLEIGLKKGKDAGGGENKTICKGFEI